MTRRIVEAAGVSVPEQVEAGDREAVQALLERGGSLVVKHARGEQGRGVAVDLDTMESVETAITNASAHSDRVIVESFHNGDDLRLIRSEEHTSELQSLMRNSYAVLRLK